jgi:LAGLIDADG endonuclease
MSSLVENGAGTGWTVKWKLSYYSNILMNKLYSMRGILIIINNFSSLLKLKEKLLLIWRKFAWIKIKNFYFIYQRLNVEHLITQKGNNLSTYNINKNSFSENKDIFYQWLIGITDGDGTFSIVRQNNKWSLTFKISQNIYNLRVLYFIKNQLKAGSIYIEKKRNHAHFRIRDKKLLDSVIFPIFDKYSLLTTKQFNYIKFKEAHAILSNNYLTKLEKDILILNLLDTKAPVDYISPIWSLIENNVYNFDSASKIMTKAWLVGFTEAEGSFYLVNKSTNRLVHGFEITQKLDKIVLIAIKHILGITTKVKVTKLGIFSIVTTNSRAIENIIKYFKNSMKGMKALEYRIWSRAYIKYKGEYLALNKIRQQMRNMKTIKNIL